MQRHTISTTNLILGNGFIVRKLKLMKIEIPLENESIISETKSVEKNREKSFDLLHERNTLQCVIALALFLYPVYFS